ncbi:VC0807 family protein [Neobacillus sp. Marseille-QA0830]
MKKQKEVVLTLLINGIVPWLIYVILSKHMSSIAALSIATLAPLADNLFFLIKQKKMDVFGSLMLFTFLLTLGLVMLGGSEKILLIRESFITAVVGIIFLGSLFFKKPLMFHLALRFIGNPQFAGNWQYDYFRFVMRLMTFVWGLILVLEATVRITLVFVLSTATYLAISNIVLYGFIGSAILWTVYYRRISSRRLASIMETQIR